MNMYQKKTIEKLKELMIKEIKEIDSDSRIASIYAETIGSYKCECPCCKNMVYAERK